MKRFDRPLGFSAQATVMRASADSFLLPDPLAPDDPIVVGVTPLDHLEPHPLMIAPVVPVRPRGRKRPLCPNCRPAASGRLLLNERGQIEAIVDPALLRRSPREVRTAALGALMADRDLWPQLLSGVMANPILRRLAAERLTSEVVTLARRVTTPATNKAPRG